MVALDELRMDGDRPNRKALLGRKDSQDTATWVTGVHVSYPKFGESQRSISASGISLRLA